MTDMSLKTFFFRRLRRAGPFESQFDFRGAFGRPKYELSLSEGHRQQTGSCAGRSETDHCIIEQYYCSWVILATKTETVIAPDQTSAQLLSQLTSDEYLIVACPCNVEISQTWQCSILLSDQAHLQKETTTLTVRMKGDDKETVGVDDFTESVIALTNQW